MSDILHLADKAFKKCPGELHSKQSIDRLFQPADAAEVPACYKVTIRNKDGAIVPGCHRGAALVTIRMVPS